MPSALYTGLRGIEWVNLGALRCTLPAPPLRKAFFPVEAWLYCGPSRHLADCEPRTTIRRLASTSSGKRSARRLARSPSMLARMDRSSSARSARMTLMPNGYDAQEGQYGDLVSKGIIDPTKVVRTALQDAGFDCRTANDDRGHGCREAEEGIAQARHAARRRHGLLVERFQSSNRRIRGMESQRCSCEVSWNRSSSCINKRNARTNAPGLVLFRTESQNTLRQACFQGAGGRPVLLVLCVGLSAPILLCVPQRGAVACLCSAFTILSSAWSQRRYMWWSTSSNQTAASHLR